MYVCNDVFFAHINLYSADDRCMGVEGRETVELAADIG